MSIRTLYPGVYVAESTGGSHVISGVSTSTTGFVGYLKRGPLNAPVQCRSFGDFTLTFGGLDSDSPTSFQVSQFFLNGGTDAWVSRLGAAVAPDGAADGGRPGGSDVAGDPAEKSGLHALDAMSQVNLICVPDMAQMPPSDYLAAAKATLDYALARRAFALLDLPREVTTPAQALAWVRSVPATLGPGLASAATYFPRIAVATPSSTAPAIVGACGTMAGLYAATDDARGVWKAPAGITAQLAGVQQLQYRMSDEENARLNPLGLNALRTFPVYGNVAWGARTLAAANASYSDWEYISVRRLALYIEQSLIQGLEWVVFEPNDEALWAQIRLSATNFLHALFAQGAFVASTPAQAYRVICDATTTTPDDMENGIVNVVVQFAPIKPAELVVISLQLRAGQIPG